jgi:hypothetical protein
MENMEDGIPLDREKTAATSAQPAGAPSLDVEKYREYVDDFDIPEEKKIELLQTLWSIMAAFVELGFRVESVPNYLPALGEMTSEFNRNEVRQDDQECAPAFNANNAPEGKDVEP